MLKSLDARAAERSVRERDAIKLAEHQRDAGLITHAEYADHYRQFTTWRKRASRFNTVLHQYLDLTADRVRRVHHDSVAESLRSTLLALAVAVDDHRQAHAGEESLADTALWARLRLLPWPTADDAGHRLVDAVAAERSRRTAARHHENSSIQYQGSHVTGENVDVADLLLEITDNAEPTCDRSQLVELWKQRTPDLLESDAAKVAASTKKGSYATYRLRRSLTFLESHGMIERNAEGDTAKVTVINRNALLSLRRQWDVARFALGDAEL
ncbi:hypothetical protein SD37_40040 [Amycolatopsis orientalis]|uniref:Uncharacterized protein n=1 Tax=Amycolatopsis orientalis TaxID=31958 RepID=A0A193C977_AMYOR|nr:hypothetical protein SD37_40040 [Amycolatopsis orientalis]